MRFWIQVFVIVGISVGLTSCETLSGFLPGRGGDEAATDASSTPATSPGVTDDIASDEGAIANNSGSDIGDNITGESEITDTTNDTTSVFDDPLVEGEVIGNVPLELIPSTTPEERIEAIQRVGQDRPDPFDLLQTLPILAVPDDVLNPPSLPQESPAPLSNNQPDNSSDRSSNTPPENDPPENPSNNQPEGSEGLAEIPDLVGILPSPPPPPPEPLTAQAVTVTGVVQIGNVPYAIVDAPNEPHSRYVRSGQLLSNGQVLVKKIVLEPGVADPVVILEEFGISVTRPVGAPSPRPNSAPEEQVGSA